jgi:dienelactone hydrolase
LIPWTCQFNEKLVTEMNTIFVCAGYWRRSRATAATGQNSIAQGDVQAVQYAQSLHRAFWAILVAVAVLMSDHCASGQVEPSKRFNEFVKQQTAALRAEDKAPATPQDWAATRKAVRSVLEKAWGGFPETPCPLEAHSLGELKRDGYRVEKIVFQTMPNVWMTSNGYVPDGENGRKYPAVLCVHGHWPGAKQDPVVQSRCIGLVRLGFFVLCVDAFGAGERAVQKKLGEYHGEMTGAMLLPIGRPLSGIQVYENMRAVDYLQSRPEVDPERIGITGASGGGNQSLYAGGFDERFLCVVPTCSVGTYQAYLTTACCICELVPGILRSTEQGNVLALSANRGLMVTSATQDAFQFSVEQAKISVARAREVAALVSAEGESVVKHTIIEAPHHYNQPMREAMYGWMTKHLKGGYDGSPLAEPKIVPEEPEVLRCYPGDSRPEDYTTLPRFAFAEARRLKLLRRDGSDRARLSALSAANSDEERRAILATERQALAAILGPVPAASSSKIGVAKAATDAKNLELTFEVEPGLEIVALCDLVKRGGAGKDQKLAILLDVDNGAEQTFSGDTAHAYRRQGYTIVAPELRATGRYAWPTDKIANAVDHNSAEWSLLIGRPLLGQWAYDVRRTLDTLASHIGSLPAETILVAQGSSAVIGITAAALDTRVSAVTAINGLASFASDRPYRGQRLGVMVPGLLRDVGDIDHIAALIAPRPVSVIGAVNGAGEAVSTEAIEASLLYCREVYARHGAADRLKIAVER